jgi:ABC-2 type transport system ATP-binding protein
VGVSDVLAASGLTKRYGRTEALRGVDLRLAPGELVGLLGPNGAGKSTLTKIACGLVRPSGGSIDVARPIGYLAELFRFPDWCRADELLAHHQTLARSSGGAGERERLLELVGLGDAARTPVGSMSKGMQQRLGIAQALIGEPKLLLLDEPTSALDPVGRRTVRDLLEELRHRGVAVLLSSHLLSEVERVCDRVVIVARGTVVAAGTPRELERPAGVEVETGTGVRVIEGAGRADVPRLVRELVAEGEEVYGVRARRSTLEDAYLEAVGQ